MHCLSAQLVELEDELFGALLANNSGGNWRGFVLEEVAIVCASKVHLQIIEGVALRQIGIVSLREKAAAVTTHKGLEIAVGDVECQERAHSVAVEVVHVAENADQPGNGVGSLLTFNISDGYLEALVRGHRGCLLSQADYANLAQCDALDDLKMHLAGTDYGNFLQNEPSPIATTVIGEKCTEKLVLEFHQLRAEAVHPLSTFLDFMRYGYMIDNIVLLISGTLHGRDINQLIQKCHPLGMFPSMKTLAVAATPADLYATVLVDTPLAPYFRECLSIQDLDEMHIEIIRNTLHKAYLEDFYQFTQSLGGSTAEVMGALLRFEADRRAINITLNSFGTELSKDDRAKLYPSFGELYPAGFAKLAKADDADTVRAAVEAYGPYAALFRAEKSLDDAFFEYEMKLNRDSFLQQFHYGLFFSWIRLKEQEIRNIVWISECISQKQKQKINQFVSPF
eukprot:TRINITY_DN1988_c0_g1_i2.p1 TRINITY_DN1988_c0_g1~~TRINITY_DN1988_c0_g1_i2.p1  ORF type:complete len:452 (+),score=113.79 TRINITY_DN1988_c0_g1_i2:721-2076(+)